jgi:hypothetical protein
MPNQSQRERPQEKLPHTGNKQPEFDSIHIEPVEDLLQELENYKKRESDKCGCWGNSKGGL